MSIRPIATTFCLMLATAALTAAIMRPGVAAQDPAIDQQKIMEAYMKAATPGEPHAKLNQLVGKWTAEITSYMNGQSETQQTECEFKSVLGGRYVIQSTSGAFGGMPFEGLGIMGFDNVAGEYFSLWLDSMGTGFLLATGKAEADAKVLEMKGTAKDAMTPEGRPWRSVQKHVDADHWTFEMYDSMPGATGFTEIKMMEITYRRKQAGAAR